MQRVLVFRLSVGMMDLHPALLPSNGGGEKQSVIRQCKTLILALALIVATWEATESLPLFK